MTLAALIQRNVGFKTSILLWGCFMVVFVRMQIAKNREEQLLAEQRAYAEQKYRKDIMTNALQRPVLNYTFPFTDSLNIPIWDHYNNVAFCWLPKNACSQIKALYCQYLTAAYGNQSSRIFQDPTKSHGKSCGVLLTTVKFWNAYQRQSVFKNPNTKKLALIREPYDRFISGWYNKCGPEGFVRFKNRTNNCYGCETVTCFAKKNLVHMRALSRLYHRAYYRMAQTTRYGTMDHFYPQFWHCDFEHYLNDYRLFYYEKTEEFNVELREALIETGINRSIVDTGWGENRNLKFLEVVSFDATSNSSHHWVIDNLKQDLEAVDCVYRTYLVDYVTLNFKIPDWVKDSCLAHHQDERSRYLVCQHLRFQEIGF